MLCSNASCWVVSCATSRLSFSDDDDDDDATKSRFEVPNRSLRESGISLFPKKWFRFAGVKTCDLGPRVYIWNGGLTLT